MKLGLALIGAGLVLAGCTGETGAPSAQQQTTLQGQIVASEVVVGEHRLPLGILDHNTPVSDATVHVRAFYLGNSGTVSKGESDAPFKGQGLQGAGVYVANLNFDVAGNWGVDLTVQRPNGSHAVLRLSVPVIATPIVPAVGQLAPQSHNPTAKEVGDVGLIDSGQPPNDMHDLSIADAIAQKRKALVVFASPAFCQTRICGPEVKVVQSLEPAYRDRLAFIHVEVYQDFKPDPTKKRLSQTVLDWRLQTEPWVFLIDAKGVIQARFEGPTDRDELKAAIDKLLAAA
jgi:hypothetical protein